MSVPDTSGWPFVGETSNSRYYLIEPDVLAALPAAGSADDLATARENVGFQNAYFRTAGHPGVVVVFFDNLVSQDKDARRIYQQEPDLTVLRGVALVGGSLLSRAIGSFFLGLSKPRIALKMFSELAEALAWAHQLNGSEKQEKRA
jgi:hypothetical protein